MLDFTPQKPKRRRTSLFHGLKENEVLKIRFDTLCHTVVFELSTQHKCGLYRIQYPLVLYRLMNLDKPTLAFALVDLLTFLRKKSMMKTIKSEAKRKW